VAISLTALTHIESAGTPARVREVHWRVMRGVWGARHGGEVPS
jgi:hypothetical protein